MKLFKLAVTFTVLSTCVNFVTAKSEPVILQNSKAGFTQKLNAVSSTTKPATEFEVIQANIQQHKPIMPTGGLRQIPAPQNLQQLATAPHNLVAHHPNLAIPQLHPQSQQQILQFIQRALYTSQLQNQPTAMIIIAQPAIVPANLIYGAQNPAQHLINYVQGNPQARYQYLQPPPQPIQHPVQQIIPTQIIPQVAGNYPVYQMPVHYHQNVVPVPVSTPAHYPVASPAHYPVTTRMLPTQPTYAYNRQDEKSNELSEIAEIAQMAAQKFYPAYVSQKSQSGTEQAQAEAQVPVQSFPPIITGFEHFTPEQQAKIKEQLSAHFGAPLQPLTFSKETANQLQNVNQASPKYETLSTRVNEYPKQEVKTSSSVTQQAYAKM